MQQQDQDVAVEETEDSSLLDCYRIALDFGMPAALKAYKKLALDSPEILELESSPSGSQSNDFKQH